MKKITFIVFVALLALSSCGGDNTEYNEQQAGPATIDHDSLLKTVQDLEAEIQAQTSPDKDLLSKAVTKFQDFAGFFPDDPLAPDYLLKASDFAMTLNEVDRSVKILDKIISNYPDYNKLEDVMYVKASHIDLNLRDTTRAKIAYQEFMEKFPESEMVDDAENRIKYISLSIEELAEKFMKELEEQPQ